MDKKTTARSAVLIAAAILVSACNNAGAPGSSAVDAGGDTPAAPHSLGVIRISVSGLGTPTPTATAENLGAPGSSSVSGPQAHVLSTLPCFLQIQSQAISSGAFNAGAAEYAAFTFKVRNAQGVTGNGCTAGTGNGTLSNLTLVGLVEPGLSISGTPFVSLQKFDGTNEPAAIALSVLPTHGMQFDAGSDTVAVDPGQESLQVFSESQLAGLAIDPGDVAGSYLLPYGFVVRNVNPVLGRTLQANPAAGQFDGQVTFAVKLPPPTTKKDAVYAFKFDLQVLVDSVTRVTESTEEQNPLGDVAANLRAVGLSSSDLAVLGGTHVTETNIGDPICKVRIAGPVASPTAYLVNNGSANVGAAPYNLTGISPLGPVRAGFCQPMTTPAGSTGIYSQFVVSGAQSGLRTAAGVYSGTYAGANTNQLRLTPNPAHPFFVGEKVDFSLTSLLSSTTNAHPVPFVGSFTVGGTVPSAAAFVPRSTTAAGDAPAGVAAGDFDGDGIADLAISNFGSAGGVTLLIGNGDGSYHPAVHSPILLGLAPAAVSVADFNGDGKPDLAVPNFGTGTVYILFGLGGADFTVGSSPSVGAAPTATAVGDFNGDGKPDLAVLVHAGVAILLNNGSGGFTLGATLTAGNDPVSVAVGDFNGDGHADLAVANFLSDNVSILLGNGAGGFTAGTTITLATRSEPIALVVRDLDGDGKLDLAVANFNAGNVSILLGNGSGGFANSSSSPIAVYGDAPQSIAVGDFDGDGKPDLAVSTRGIPPATVGGPGTVTILLNGGGGFFGQSFPVATVGSEPTSVIVGDFNGDGRADVITANNLSKDFTVALGTGTGNLGTAAPLPQLTFATGNAPQTVATGDFNGDGKLDLAVVDQGGNDVSILLAVPGGYNLVNSISVGAAPYAVVTGDFNRDGKLDLAVTVNGGNTVSILLGDGTGAFAVSSVAAGSAPTGITTGDFNADGKADLAVANGGGNNVSILLGNGSGGFAAASPATVAVGATPLDVAVSDFNADGKLDLAVANSAGNTVSILLGNGSGGFSAASPATVATGSTPVKLAASDLNGDGKPDLAVTNSAGNSVSILLGNGSGGFSAAADSPLAVGGSPSGLAIGDENGDGKLDLAVTNSAGNSVSILLGNGKGSFGAAPGSPLPVGSSPRAVVMGDFFGTHKLGLAVVNAGENSVSLVPQK